MRIYILTYIATYIHMYLNTYVFMYVRHAYVYTCKHAYMHALIIIYHNTAASFLIYMRNFQNCTAPKIAQLPRESADISVKPEHIHVTTFM